jgi:signal transduction histidine kinase
VTDNSLEPSIGRSIALDVVSPKSQDELRREVEELRASRERLVLDGDAERRRLERELHEGLQQRLVALSVSLQRAASRVEAEPAAVFTELDEIARQVQDALGEAARLAERIHPPLLEQAGRLAAELRAAAVRGSVTTTVEVGALPSCPPEIAHTILLCWLEALERSRPDTRPAIDVHAEDDSLVFEIVSEASLERMRDRVEALGGHMTVETTPAGTTRAAGTLPLAGRA